MKRLQKQLEECSKMEGFRISKDGDNLFVWKTPFEGGVFELLIKFPENYPFKFPNIKFQTKIYHPNVSNEGEICKDILGESEWLPTKKLSSVLEKLRSMMIAPEVDHPINAEAARDYKSGKYHEVAKQWTAKHALKK